jgi:peptidoglycan hydrolase-like protein with peptidoglycan-binding domain
MKKYLSIVALLITIFTSASIVGAQNIATLRSSVTPGFEFKMDLRLGDTDSDVKELQRVLNTDIDTKVAMEGPGSYGKETTYFGEATKSAVIRFQHKYRNTVLTPNGYTMGHGNVDKATRTRLNLLIGVITTYDSTGYPQNRGGNIVVNTPVSTPNPPPVQTVTRTQMSTCEFVELLINIRAINPNKADAGRRALNCPVNLAQAEPTVVYVPVSINLKVNNQKGAVSIISNSTVNVSWSARGVKSCTGRANNQNITGKINASTSGNLDGNIQYNIGSSNQTLTMNCETKSGENITDSVLISVTNPVSDNLQAICTASPINGVTGSPITWEAQVTGGSSYTYFWSGTEGLSGNTKTINKTYFAPGTKNASVTVYSGTVKTIANCTMSINSASTTTSTTFANAWEAIRATTTKKNVIKTTDIGASEIVAPVTTAGPAFIDIATDSKNQPHILGQEPSRHGGGLMYYAKIGLNALTAYWKKQDPLVVEPGGPGHPNIIIDDEDNGWISGNTVVVRPTTDEGANLAYLPGVTGGDSDDETLDHGLFIGIPVPCVHPAEHFRFAIYSTEENKTKSYIWDVGSSEMDAKAVAMLAATGFISGGYVFGSYGDIHLGRKTDCFAGGDARKIIKIYGGGTDASTPANSQGGFTPLTVPHPSSVGGNNTSTYLSLISDRNSEYGEAVSSAELQAAMGSSDSTNALFSLAVKQAEKINAEKMNIGSQGSTQGLFGQISDGLSSALNNNTGASGTVYDLPGAVYENGLQHWTGNWVGYLGNVLNGGYLSWFKSIDPYRGFVGYLSNDPYHKNTAYFYPLNETPLAKFTSSGYQSSDLALKAGKGGEKGMFKIAPRANQEGIWHASSDVHYINQTMSKGIDWASWNTYEKRGMGDDGSYVDLGIDWQKPEVAYLVGSFGPGVAINIWNGSKMLYSSKNLHIIDAKPATFGNGLRRFSPKWTPAQGGGAFLCWTSADNQIKLKYITHEGESKFGPTVTIGSGYQCNVSTDTNGNIDLAYVSGGSLVYRKIITSVAP